MILVDTSYYISYLIETDSNYNTAHTLANKINLPLTTTEDVIKESLTVISQRKGKSASISFYQDLVSATKVITPTTADFQTGLKIFLDKNLQKDISLIDCIISAIYKRTRASAILTFDPHFTSLGCKIFS